MFVIDTLTKEKQLLDLGVDTYVIKDDIEEYIEKIAKNEVSFVELERYERDIPEDVVKKIEELKNIVPKFYILFTDYTHKLQKKLQKETEVARDPILFGVFEDNIHINERFYFIADWVDEYCDLTFDKFVSAFQRDVSYKSTSPDKLKDLHAYLDSLELRNGKYVKKQSYKPGFLERLKNAYRYLVGKTSNIYINY